MASFQFQTAGDPQKPAYLSKMVDITDRLVSLLGLETLKEKQDEDKRAIEVEKDLGETKACWMRQSLQGPNFNRK